MCSWRSGPGLLLDDGLSRATGAFGRPQRLARRVRQRALLLTTAALVVAVAVTVTWPAVQVSVRSFVALRGDRRASILRHRGAEMLRAAAGRDALEVEVVESSSAEFAMDYALPIGPSCPFRSSIMEGGALDNELAYVVSEATGQSGEFGMLATQVAAGIQPDPRRSKKVGMEMNQQGERLKGVLDKMETSTDFQAMEAYMTMELNARKVGAVSMRTVQALVTWQGQGLIAMADNQPMPPTPPGVDFAAVANAAPGTMGGNPKERMFCQPALPRTLPFSAMEFDAVESEESQLLQVEYRKLVKDHQQLVGLGESFGDFDAAGKEYYLDQFAGITTRWKELFVSAREAGVRPSAGFQAFSKEYLSRASLSPAAYFDLVQEVHSQIKQQVQASVQAGR